MNINIVCVLENDLKECTLKAMNVALKCTPNDMLEFSTINAGESANA